MAENTPFDANDEATLRTSSWSSAEEWCKLARSPEMEPEDEDTLFSEDMIQKEIESRPEAEQLKLLGGGCKAMCKAKQRLSENIADRYCDKKALHRILNLWMLSTGLSSVRKQTEKRTLSLTFKAWGLIVHHDGERLRSEVRELQDNLQAMREDLRVVRQQRGTASIAAGLALIAVAIRKAINDKDAQQTAALSKQDEELRKTINEKDAQQTEFRNKENEDMRQTISEKDAQQTAVRNKENEEMRKTINEKGAQQSLALNGKMEELRKAINDKDARQAAARNTENEEMRTRVRKALAEKSSQERKLGAFKLLFDRLRQRPFSKL